MSRKWWIGLLGFGGLGLILLVALLVVAIVSGSPNETAQGGGGEEQSEEVTEKQVVEEKTTSDKTQKQKASSKSIPPQSIAVGVGEEGALQDRTVIVNDVQRPFTYPRNSPRPKEGNEFVIMNVTITNTSSQPIDVSPGADFQSEDSNGVRYRAQSSDNHPNAISRSSIAPNGELTGNVVVEVPQGDPVANLVYQRSP